ncbi:MAG: hypothetical protein J0L92_41960, partial [Deltaproteobacteria bacterium]|nr:hypothetical protein [Deltaproteobacteria bacterium]
MLCVELVSRLPLGGRLEAGAWCGWVTRDGGASSWLVTSSKVPSTRVAVMPKGAVVIGSRGMGRSADGVRGGADSRAAGGTALVAAS